MTVSTTLRTISYNGDGVTDVFAVTFAFYEIKVTHVDASDVETVWSEGTEYSVTGGAGLTGSITVAGGFIPASGEKVRIDRMTTRTQLVDYVDNDEFPAASHEGALDRLTMITQENAERIDNSLQIPLGGGTIDALGARIENMADPISLSDAATKAYTDSLSVASGNVPAGGTAGQVLTKDTATDYDMSWSDHVIYTYQGRSAANAAEIAALADGSIVAVNGLFYEVDSTVLLADSVFNDLGVAGVKANGIVSPEHYGAVGDGTANDQAAIERTLNGSGGSIVDGRGKTYRADDKIDVTTENIVIQNATFDMSNVPDLTGSPDFLINFTGTQETATNLSANAAKGANVLTVADTSSFTADDYAWLSSSATFDATTSTVLGQYVKIKTVDSATQISLYNDVLYDFNTSDTAQIAKLTLKENIRFENCDFIGGNANTQSMLNFEKCADVNVVNCRFSFVDYIACLFSRTVNGTFTGSTVRHARAVGTSYGVAVHNGCYNTRVINSFGEDLRHFVTVGNNDGVNLFTQVIGNHITACQDAGIDSHASGDFMVISGNTIEGSSYDSGQLDGIIFQGLNVVISNNQIVGIRRHGVYVQSYPEIGSGSCVISGNSVLNGGGSAGTDIGVYVLADGTGTNAINDVVITGNVLDGVHETGIQVYAFNKSINDVSIVGNVAGEIGVSGIVVRSSSGDNILSASISGNSLSGSSATGSGIQLLGASANGVKNVSITGNTVDDFVFGLRATFTTKLAESSNVYTNYTDPYEIATNCSEINLNPVLHGNPRTVTTATFTMEEDDTHFVCSRAGTITLTLLDPTVYAGMTFHIKTVQAQAVVSSASNVVAVTGTTPGTSILPAVDGSWASLTADGTNWIIMSTG